MKKIALAAFSATAMLALSACGDAADEPVVEETTIVEEAPVVDPALDPALDPAVDAAADADAAAVDATDTAEAAADAEVAPVQ